MQSRRSGSVGPFLNPTILAMVGSVGAHGVLALISALHPAEGKPSTLQVLSIAPQGNYPKIKGPGTLSVPNGLPSINSGNVPQLPPAPDMSVAKIKPSQSLYVGSPSNLNKLSVTNIPSRSFPDLSLPNAGQINIPNSIFGGKAPPVLGTSGNVRGSASTYNPNDYSPSANPTLPQLPQPNNNGSFPPNVAPGVSPSGQGSTDTTYTARQDYKKTLQGQYKRYGQQPSAQDGKTLRADYPPEACESRQNGVARVSGLYDQNGVIVSRNEVHVHQSSGNLALDNAAIEEVMRYRPNAAGVFQSFVFEVDIPYSSSKCLATQPSPSASPTFKPGSTASPSPSTSISPSPSPEPTNVPSSTGQPEQPLAPPKAIPIGPNDIPTEPQSPPKQPAPVPSAVPEPAPAESPAPNTSASPSLEPLPQSSIAPTETPQPKP